MSKLITNGRAFPLEVKAATIAEINANPVKRRSHIAVERNMSVATVARWAHAEAGCTLSNHQHPKTAEAVRNRWAKYAQTKKFNTPIVSTNGTTTASLSFFQRRMPDWALAQAKTISLWILFFQSPKLRSQMSMLPLPLSVTMSAEQRELCSSDVCYAAELLAISDRERSWKS